jgi:hypothetical protein
MQQVILHHKRYRVIPMETVLSVALMLHPLQQQVILQVAAVNGCGSSIRTLVQPSIRFAN